MPTRYAGLPEERLALDAYIKLSRALHAVDTRIHRHLQDRGLTVSQFGVLEALLHVGPMSQRQLAQKILRSSGNLTMVIDNLERDGLVRREKSDRDRRVMNVFLTDQGRELIAGMIGPHVQGVQEVMGELSEVELSQLAGLCRRLGHAAAGKAGAESPV